MDKFLSERSSRYLDKVPASYLPSLLPMRTQQMTTQKRKRIQYETNRQLAMAKRQRLASQRAAANTVTMVVPGFTRSVGAYQRSIPGSIEKKYFETSIVNVGSNIAGSVLNSLNLVPQGTTDQTRIGNKISIRNINIHGYMSYDDQTTGAFGAGNLRVILFVDKQCNGATALVTDILKSASIESFRNMDQVDRFTILKDIVFEGPQLVANALHTSQTTKYWSLSAKCDLPIHFSSTTGAITELRSNNIGMLYITDGAAVNPASLGVARVKFTDD